jgi:carbon monoxide dehydrogenase subunit G
VPDGGFTLSTQLDVARSPEDVFAFLADIDSFRALDPALIECTPSGRLEAGLSGTFAHRRGGMTARTTWRVTVFAPPHLLEVAIRGAGYEMTERADVAGDGSGTRATFVDRVWPTSLAGRVLVALSGGIMRRDLLARAERLKAILEGATQEGRAD